MKAPFSVETPPPELGLLVLEGLLAVSSVVRTLAAKGWVDRQNGRRDRRAKVLRITSLRRGPCGQGRAFGRDLDRQFFLDPLGARKQSVLKRMDRLAQAGRHAREEQ